MTDEPGNGRRNDPNGRTPVPDPTFLTTQALEREVEQLEGQLQRRLLAEREVVEGQLEVLRERLSGIDRATELRLTGIVEIPNQIDEKVGKLSALTDERFKSIQQQFTERDTRSERESRDNKVAVDAAFAAQKEAAAKQDEGNQKGIDKSEAATQETINKLSLLVATQIAALGDKVDDLKERVARIESIKQGGNEARAGLSSGIGTLVAVIGVAIAVVAFIATRQ